MKWRAAATIFRLGLRQLLGGKRTIALALLGLLPAVVMLLGAGRFSPARAYEFAHEGPLPVLLAVVAPVIALTLATSSLGEERRDGTLSFLVLRPIPRWLIVAAKLASAAVAAFAVTAVGTLALGAAIGWRAETWSPLPALAVMVAVNAVGYVAVFGLLGYFAKRAILIGLAFVFIWENGISFVPGLATLSLWRIGASAYAAMEPAARQLLSEPLGDVAPGSGGAVAKAVVLAALAVAALATSLVRRDVAR